MLENPDEPWNWSYLSNNRTISAEFKMINYHLPWDWNAMNYNGFPWDFILANADKVSWI